MIKYLSSVYKICRHFVQILHKDCANHIAQSMHTDVSENFAFCMSLRRDDCIWIQQEGRVWLSDFVAWSIKSFCKWEYSEMLKELMLQRIILFPLVLTSYYFHQLILLWKERDFWNRNWAGNFAESSVLLHVEGEGVD